MTRRRIVALLAVVLALYPYVRARMQEDRRLC